MKIIAILTLLLGLYSCGQNNDQNNFESNMDEINNTPPIGVPEDPENKQLVKIPIYNNVYGLRESLSENGIGTLGDWKSNIPEGYSSITFFHAFGSGLLPSNISYNIESESRDYARSVTLAMNINSKGNRKEGKDLFSKTAQKTFKSIELDMPLQISEAIGYGKSKTVETKAASITLKVDKGEIENWVLKITTK